MFGQLQEQVQIDDSLKYESSGINKSNTIPVEATPTEVVETPDIIPKSPE